MQPLPLCIIVNEYYKKLPVLWKYRCIDLRPKARCRGNRLKFAMALDFMMASLSIVLLQTFPKPNSSLWQKYCNFMLQLICMFFQYNSFAGIAENFSWLKILYIHCFAIESDILLFTNDFIKCHTIQITWHLQLRRKFEDRYFEVYLFLQNPYFFLFSKILRLIMLA